MRIDENCGVHRYTVCTVGLLFFATKANFSNGVSRDVWLRAGQPTQPGHLSAKTCLQITQPENHQHPDCPGYKNRTGLSNERSWHKRRFNLPTTFCKIAVCVVQLMSEQEPYNTPLWNMRENYVCT